MSFLFVSLKVFVFLLVAAVNKAFKTLENEEGYKRCQEIVEEARNIVQESVSLIFRNTVCLAILCPQHKHANYDVDQCTIGQNTEYFLSD
jgi:hypothetical protein